VRPRAHILIALVLLVMIGGAALGVERFPPPDFESGHTFPATQYPAPRSVVLEYLDVAVLFVALVLASFYALKVRSRRWLFILMLASLAYFGFWRKGCVCSVGAVQNVALGVFNSGYAVPVTVLAFFLLPLAFTLLFGRTFCAAVCPLGAMQDFVLVRPVRVPWWLEQGLRVLPVVYLALAVVLAGTGSAFVICDYDPFVAFFRRSGNASMLIFSGCILAIGVFVGRPYCRFLCPYGVLLGWLSRVSRWRVRITPDECIQCRLCEDACPFGAIRAPDEAPAPSEVAAGRRRVGWQLVAVPVLVVVGAMVFGVFRFSLARMHPQVRLAERVWQEEKGEVEGQTDASKAFRRTGQPVEELYAEARAIRADVGRLGWGVGALVGLVVGLRVLGLTVRRRQTDYEADRSECLACGRCFEYCPNEKRRRKAIEDA